MNVKGFILGSLVVGTGLAAEVAFLPVQPSARRRNRAILVQQPPAYWVPAQP
jgi:hypothetical protein